MMLLLITDLLKNATAITSGHVVTGFNDPFEAGNLRYKQDGKA